MIIFRLKRKLFGVATINNLEEFLGGGDSKHGGIMTISPLNIMKSLEMWTLTNPHGKSYVPHWIEEMVFDEVLEKLIKKGIAPQKAFAIFEDEKTLRSVFGSNLAEEYILNNYPTAVDVYQKIEKRLLTEVKKGTDSTDPKYKQWFDKNPIQLTSEDYIQFFKYISLCLSGQLNPQVDTDFWGLSRKIQTTKVNYEIIKYRVKKDIVGIIIDCIKNFYGGYIPDEVSNGLLNY